MLYEFPDVIKTKKKNNPETSSSVITYFPDKTNITEV